MTVYFTKRGVLVYGGHGWVCESERGKPRGFGWKVPCWRAETGGWHGWLWSHNLTQVHA